MQMLALRVLRSLMCALVLTQCTFGADIEFHFVNVGQGDSTIIVCPDGRRVLIDCGSLAGADKHRVRDYIHEHLDQDNPVVDVLIVTHPDQDHYNLLPFVLAGVGVKQALYVGTPDEYPVAGFENWLQGLGERAIAIKKTEFDPPEAPSARFGQGDVKFFILAADTQGTQSPKNTRSIVVNVSFGEFDVILTGDGTHTTENLIMERYPANWLDIEILKIGHHGSSTTSTSVEWANMVKPQSAVVSCAYANGFGHPRKQVIEHLEPHTLPDDGHAFRHATSQTHFTNVSNYQESIYSTATNGDIVVTSDGQSYTFSFAGIVVHDFDNN